MSLSLRSIPNYNKYFVDDIGNVYSTKSGTMKQLSAFYDKGYRKVSFSLDGRTVNRRVARLVLLSFRPLENILDNRFYVVDHVNGIKDDDRLENLEWVTMKENMRRARELEIARKNAYTY